MRKGMIFLVLIAFLAVPAIVSAVPLAVDGGWSEFYFGGEDSDWYYGGEDPVSFDFTISTSAYLTVTDAFLSGDQFYVSGLGYTSAPTSLSDDIGGDYDAAAADDRWSTGSWLLTAGIYSISGTANISPFGGGGGAIRVDTAPVPEPGTIVLMGLGLVGLAGMGRKKYFKK
ncbi:MAG: PEP-CTERM sorting domain-containing protein [Desulfobacteraceae bacterium]|nr:PEP-CTERM sorting domain-containing protein [Desulfobacteraceae bacterium]MBC2751163.1 PEP-CTERM sorting domain-containing protein [Desulfobacteraceae bacterium]